MRESGEIIKEALEEISGCFEGDTKKNVKELLAGGEPGIALEVLCSQLVEFDVAITLEVKEKLSIAAKMMGMEIEDLQDISIL